MVSSIPNFLWNQATQKVLSQTNNVSYWVRGEYRVWDTQDSRKGDYYFRDVSMVMACAYMTEMGFRAVEKWYTAPLITKAFELNKLSQQKHAITQAPLYQNARNYPGLPNVVRERLMGSLIGKSSSNLVPSLMKELELRQASKLEGIADDVKTLLSSPTTQADSIINKYLNEHGLMAQHDSIRSISRLENQARRTDAIRKLITQHPSLNEKAVENAVKLEDARQMGVLMDHLHRNLNFKEYMQGHYLNSQSKLSGAVGDVLTSFSDRLSDLQQKGRRELPDLLHDLRKLPATKRQDAFNKKIIPYRNLLYYKDGIQLVQPEHIRKFEQLVGQMRGALNSESKNSLQKPIQELEEFYQALEAPEVQNHTLNQLWSHSATDLKKQIASKIEGAIDDVRKLSPDQARHTALDKKFQDLKFDSQHPEFQQKLDTLLDKIKTILPNEANHPVDRHSIKAALQEFTAELPDEAEKLLKPFVKASQPEEFKRMIVDGMKSKTMLDLVSKIQKNGTWPKMAATVILNLIFYGWAASNFDNKILQPYQQKLVAERGTAQDIVTAGHLGMIPGGLVLTQLIDKYSLPMLRKMSHFNRFALVGGAALATFAGSSYLALQQLVKLPPNPAKVPPKPPAAPNTSSPAIGNPPAASAFAPGAGKTSPFQSIPSSFSKPGFTPGHGPAFPLFAGPLNTDN